MEELRVSVRELVEFTLHGADIRLISGRMQDMLDGTLGHQARQKLLGDGWQAEVPLNLPILVEDEELTLVLGGRMDAFRAWRKSSPGRGSIRRKRRFPHIGCKRSAMGICSAKRAGFRRWTCAWCM